MKDEQALSSQKQEALQEEIRQKECLVEELQRSNLEQTHQIERLSSQLLSLTKENKEIIDSIREMQFKLDSDTQSSVSFAQSSQMDNMGSLVEQKDLMIEDLQKSMRSLNQ